MEITVKLTKWLGSNRYGHIVQYARFPHQISIADVTELSRLLPITRQRTLFNSTHIPEGLVTLDVTNERKQYGIVFDFGGGVSRVINISKKADMDSASADWLFDEDIHPDILAFCDLRGLDLESVAEHPTNGAPWWKDNTGRWRTIQEIETRVYTWKHA